MVKSCKQVQSDDGALKCVVSWFWLNVIFMIKSYVEFYFFPVLLSLFKLTTIWILEMNTLRFYVWIKSFFLINFYATISHSYGGTHLLCFCSCTQIWSLHMKTSLIAYVNFWKNQNKHFVSMCSHIVMVINVCNGYIS
jgi:hypothetical protein